MAVTCTCLSLSAGTISALKRFKGGDDCERDCDQRVRRGSRAVHIACRWRLVAYPIMPCRWSRKLDRRRLVTTQKRRYRILRDERWKESKLRNARKDWYIVGRMLQCSTSEVPNRICEDASPRNCVDDGVWQGGNITQQYHHTCIPSSRSFL